MNSISALVNEIALGWSDYKKTGVVDSKNPVHQLVTRVLPQTLSETLSDNTNLKIKGSVGLGNITAAPWVGTFDKRITTSASAGYYIVYLFSVDMKSLHLCFGLGATQFIQAFSTRKQAYEAMDAARTRLLDVVLKHLPSDLKQKINAGDIDLIASSPHKLHKDYERANVLHLKYQLSNLPSESELLQDYISIVSFYEKVVDDPLTPEPVTLLKGTAELDARKIRVTERSFSPRQRQIKGSVGGEGSGYSKKAKIVGDAGELAVLELERSNLIALGRKDLASSIVHEEAEGSRPGWDITSYDADGRTKRIEVKSCEGKAMNKLEITRNEWQAASEHLEEYYIYLVMQALSQNPVVEVIRNPYELVKASKLALQAQRYLLDLCPPASENN